MAYKIVIDAGHGGRDPGAVYNGRQEKDDVLKLALAVGDILEQNGIDVVYTRTTDVYDTPYEKAIIANNSNADYFVSIHRNAMPIPGSQSGVETLVFEDEGVKSELARNINQNLADLGFTNRGVIERPRLAVLRRTRMPAVLVEVGFIDNKKDNELFDKKFDAIAGAIAGGILETLDMKETPEPKLYRVQVGAYRMKNLAQQLLNQLLSEGFPAFMIYEDGLYKVQVGAYTNMENAVRMEQKLRRMDYNTYLTT